jgi:hypothetical protein
MNYASAFLVLILGPVVEAQAEEERFDDLTPGSGSKEKEDVV